MYTDEMRVTQKDWAGRGLLLMREFLPLMGAFACAPGLETMQRLRLGMLLTAAARSSESAFLLMAHGQLWDSEGVVRSIFEASVKFAFIVQDRGCFEQRYKEFFEDQFNISILKDDQKARRLLESLHDPDAPQWKPIRDLVLPDAEREELRVRYDKTARRTMDIRWGYMGMLDSLSRSGDPLYRKFSGLSYSYAMASHIQHADCVGVLVAMDRDLRSQRRRDSAHMAHLARLISDCFTCFILRIGAAYRFANCDPSPIAEINKKIEQFDTDMKLAQERWLEIEYGSSSVRSESGSN